MSISTDDLRDSRLAEEAEAVTEEINPDGSPTDPGEEMSVKERVAATTGAAYAFVSKAPRWMKRKAVNTKAKLSDAEISSTVGEKLGKAWAKFRHGLQKINWVAVGLTAFAICVWVAWMFIVWFCLLWWVLLAFAISPILGWCVGVMAVGFGLSFSTAFTMNIVDTVDNAI